MDNKSLIKIEFYFYKLLHSSLKNSSDFKLFSFFLREIVNKQIESVTEFHKEPYSKYLLNLYAVTIDYGKFIIQSDGQHLEPNINRYIDRNQENINKIIHLNKSLFEEIKSFFETS